MTKELQKEIVKQIEIAKEALLAITFLCEEHQDLCNELSKGYPFHLSLDEIVYDVWNWKDEIEEMEIESNE